MWRRRKQRAGPKGPRPPSLDRKSTRLNSSHSQISYAVFCLKKKKISYDQSFIFFADGDFYAITNIDEEALNSTAGSFFPTLPHRLHIAPYIVSPMLPASSRR